MIYGSRISRKDRTGNRIITQHLNHSVCRRLRIYIKSQGERFGVPGNRFIVTIYPTCYLARIRVKTDVAGSFIKIEITWIVVRLRKFNCKDRTGNRIVTQHLNHPIRGRLGIYIESQGKHLRVPIDCFIISCT